MSSTTSPSPGHAPASTERLPWAALLVMALMGFLLITTETMPAGLLPQVAAGLGTTEGAAGQLVSAYALGTVVATIPLVAATRGLRRKPVLLVGIAGFLVVNTATALAGGIGSALVVRLLAGAFSGLLWGMLAGYARRITPPTLAGRALAVASLGTPVGLAVGTPFGSWLGRTVDWRWSFGTLSVLMALTLVLAVTLVPDAPGQPAASHLPVGRVLLLPGVALVLVVILTWMVAHNTVYTYVSAYLRAADVGLPVDVALVVFGVAALGGIAVTAALVDRVLRRLVLASIALFTAAGVVLLVGQHSTAAVVAALVCWGLGYGGAATQLQTAVSEASGENADVANSMLGVAFNLAIFGGGVLGALLITGDPGVTLPLVMVALPLVALAVAAGARRTAFPTGR
ncbi:MFS transporter [Microlunatus capsulatus]|uniref:MFS family arabinose efflux permease n=1 Tax=Microlunatus capsulatus TaxID=99117 RepID=A0ABS4Z4I6_9ACTN|nr:MFS transporter [Microlunatus capsulatus]MBP2415911.1 putative MFS family arabinose efflux permease [Microlunatus capsulatus]